MIVYVIVFLWLFRPLVEVLKRSGYVELIFNIDASHFKDSQSLHDSVVEEFKQVCYSVVFSVTMIL